MIDKTIFFNTDLHFEIVSEKNVIIYNATKYFLINGISAQIMRTIIIMHQIPVAELVQHCHSSFKKTKNLEQKVLSLIEEMSKLQIITLK